ncbi:hypothetical protein HDU96_000149 [Phlyctochytrium bullatum]|nr:hypothetical protein HDU96_000149 [Phlyctochytrium bullatum]
MPLSPTEHQQACTKRHLSQHNRRSLNSLIATLAITSVLATSAMASFDSNAHSNHHHHHQPRRRDVTSQKDLTKRAVDGSARPGPVGIDPLAEDPPASTEDPPPVVDGTLPEGTDPVQTEGDGTADNDFAGGRHAVMDLMNLGCYDFNDLLGIDLADLISIRATPWDCKEFCHFNGSVERTIFVDEPPANSTTSLPETVAGFSTSISEPTSKLRRRADTTSSSDTTSATTTAESSTTTTNTEASTTTTESTTDTTATTTTSTAFPSSTSPARREFKIDLTKIFFMSGVRTRLNHVSCHCLSTLLDTLNSTESGRSRLAALFAAPLAPAEGRAVIGSADEASSILAGIQARSRARGVNKMYCPKRCWDGSDCGGSGDGFYTMYLVKSEPPTEKTTFLPNSAATLLGGVEEGDGSGAVTGAGSETTEVGPQPETAENLFNVPTARIVLAQGPISSPENPTVRDLGFLFEALGVPLDTVPPNDPNPKVTTVTVAGPTPPPVTTELTRVITEGGSTQTIVITVPGPTSEVPPPSTTNGPDPGPGISDSPTPNTSNPAGDPPQSSQSTGTAVTAINPVGGSAVNPGFRETNFPDANPTVVGNPDAQTFSLDASRVLVEVTVTQPGGSGFTVLTSTLPASSVGVPATAFPAPPGSSTTSSGTPRAAGGDSGSGVMTAAAVSGIAAAVLAIVALAVIGALVCVARRRKILVFDADGRQVDVSGAAAVAAGMGWFGRRKKARGVGASGWLLGGDRNASPEAEEARTPAMMYSGKPRASVTSFTFAPSEAGSVAGAAVATGAKRPLMAAVETPLTPASETSERRLSYASESDDESTRENVYEPSGPKVSHSTSVGSEVAKGGAGRLAPLPLSPAMSVLTETSVDENPFADPVPRGGSAVSAAAAVGAKRPPAPPPRGTSSTASSPSSMSTASGSLPRTQAAVPTPRHPGATRPPGWATPVAQLQPLKTGSASSVASSSAAASPTTTAATVRPAPPAAAAAATLAMIAAMRSGPHSSSRRPIHPLPNDGSSTFSSVSSLASSTPTPPPASSSTTSSPAPPPSPSLYDAYAVPPAAAAYPKPSSSNPAAHPRLQMYLQQQAAVAAGWGEESVGTGSPVPTEGSRPGSPGAVSVASSSGGRWGRRVARPEAPLPAEE